MACTITLTYESIRGTVRNTEKARSFLFSQTPFPQSSGDGSTSYSLPIPTLFLVSNLVGGASSHPNMALENAALISNGPGVFLRLVLCLTRDAIDILACKHDSLNNFVSRSHRFGKSKQIYTVGQRVGTLISTVISP